MTEIKWEEPPAPQSGPGSSKWEAAAQQLRANPGRWALLSEEVHSTLITHIRRGKFKAWQPAGAFEARGVSAGMPGRSKVWARYVGEGGAR